MMDLVDRMEVLTLVGNAFLNNKTMGQTLDAICNLPNVKSIEVSDAMISSLADHLYRMLEISCNTCKYSKSLWCEPTCQVANSAWDISKDNAKHIITNLIEHFNMLRANSSDEEEQHAE